MGGLIGVATSEKNGLAEKGSMPFYVVLEQGNEKKFNKGYCLIQVGSSTNGHVGLFLKRNDKLISIYSDSIFSITDEEGKICFLNIGEYEFKIVNKTEMTMSVYITIIGGRI